MFFGEECRRSAIFMIEWAFSTNHVVFWESMFLGICGWFETAKQRKGFREAIVIPVEF